jgi:hypothetical protein
VYQLLGTTVPATDILSRIEERFGPSSATKQRNAERVEAEKLAAEQDHLERIENLRVAREMQMAANAAEERVEAAKKISEAAELARLNDEKRQIEKLEAINRRMAEDEARKVIASERAERLRKWLAIIGRHQLRILMMCLLALLYLAFAYA